MLDHNTEKREGDPKVIKNKAIAGYDTKKCGYDAKTFDNWFVLQKINPSYYAISCGNILTHTPIHKTFYRKSILWSNI